MADQSEINRYGFHAPITNEKAGVSPAFVHSSVIDRVEALLKNAEKAFSLKSGDPDYRMAVDLLRKCCVDLRAPLEPTKSTANDVNDAVESVTRNYGPSTF
ncbi:hypothetical protein [Legionella shakespearei]|uniref:Uncharacterized protein n=2 Tax=Legionella shakespearei TaxID=45075 RepID=A0A0W0Z9T2_9GAMM|nr:hypothetical protein [Legionella shakespearei]AAX56164.1 unknown [Legionella shakespearei]KTD65867.1 hypothetical protein Lsha_0228 [Legionella shakespearei DSM 23087]